MTARIDGELEHHLLSTFTGHINECRSCRNEYELERMTKNIVKQIVTPAKAPPSVVAAIRQTIATLPPEVTHKSLLDRISRYPVRTTALAFAVVGIVLMFIISTPPKSHRSHTQPVDANIVHQTYNNFDKVLKSSFVTTDKSDDSSLLTTSLSKCRCNLHLPLLKQCKLIKGMHSLYNDDHIAEFVFARNNAPVYVYEAKLQDVLNGGKPRIDPEVLNELLETGWYFENHQPDCSLILKLVDSTIYCTVADMRKEQLLALLR